MSFRYINLAQAIETHAKTIDVSGGGSTTVLNKGQLDSILTQIQNDDYYPEFIDKITHLFFSANKLHCFCDGNKRIAIVLSMQFMLSNGYMYCVGRFTQTMESVSQHLAAGKITKELLKDMINSVIQDTIDEDEELKLRYLHAITDDE